ncbi:DNA-binding MarR family transcriptional regulator [Novosphingobium sp. 1529]|uniref:winged helix-turn-helix domain-containing protein n=1 Tax=Novosphingobium sp. 1529 TaxID=3156424 RepID=UPI003391075D
MVDLSEAPSEPMRAEACRILARMRAATGACFGGPFAATPRLDILTELYLAACEDRPLHAWSLCLALQVPPSTAHRKIGELERLGLVTSRRGAGAVSDGDSGRDWGRDSGSDAPRRDNRYLRVSLTPEGHARTRRLLDLLLQIWGGAGQEGGARAP